MSGSSFTSLGNGRLNGGRQLSDEKMEQVRELLFGEFEKQTEARVAHLEHRVRELEMLINTRLDALEARIEAKSGEMDATQRSAFEELSLGVQDLAQRIRRVAET